MNKTKEAQGIQRKANSCVLVHGERSRAEARAGV